ncbi:restriction endonuclease subunit S [uncultured Cetobacterium sp.]|uniref:restriction endonuclease subunit S n=1 Tax=uncultured Cetobacterium sp. TaxID=527638 RepID=UPI002617749E|nr:restriction endonuclease subunit S [uncultured Cetobacterium sp.]
MSKKKEVTIEDKLKEALISKEQQFYTLPNSWKWVKIGILGDYKKGPFGSSLTKSMFVPKSTSSIKVYEQKNAIKKDWKLGEYYITKEYYETSMKGFKVKSGDIIVSCAGTIGETYILPEEIEEGIINQALMKITLNSLTTKEYYIKYFDFMLKKISNSFSKGTAIKNIPPFKVFKELQFPLPPLEEQERIVKKLDSMLGRINEAKELIAQAKETFENRRASILNLAFSGELTRKWRESNSIESSKILLENLNKEKIRLWEDECEKALEEGKKKPLKPKLLSVEEMAIPKEEQPYEIPDNWEWVKLEGIIEYTTNLDIQKKLDKNETINYVDIESINNKLFKINTIKEKKVSELSTRARRVLKKGYMMYSLVRPYLNNFALIEEEKENFIGSTGFAVFKSKVSPIKYIFYYMQTNYIKEYYQSFLKGFNSPSITIENFNSTSVPLPPLEEQKEIVRILDNVLKKEDKINEILEMEEMIELLEKSILDKAFRGELGTENIEDIPSLEVLKKVLEVE